MSDDPSDPFYLMMLRYELGYRAQRGAAAGRSALSIAIDSTRLDSSFWDAIDSMLFHAGVVDAFIDPHAKTSINSDRAQHKRLRRELRRIADPHTDRGLWTQIRGIRNDAAHIDQAMIDAFIASEPISLRASSVHDPTNHYSWNAATQTLGMRAYAVRIPDLEST